jgi:hypothetical protein
MTTRKIKRGDVVVPLSFIPGSPIGLTSDTRCVVRETRTDRVRVEREDGHAGSWWIDRTNVRRYGH